jgi:hypothetical protein
MDCVYSYILPENTSIFRATTKAKEGRWYTLDLESAYIYGETITEYKTTKKLKLINITSLTFHLDFIDRLNILFTGDNYNGVSIEKMKCLIPLGLVNLDTQQEMIKILGANIDINIGKWNDILELLSKLLLNRHRFSEHSLDTFLIETLEKIYGNTFDGMISPIKLPSIIHGGLFPRELCIFNHGNVKEITTYKRPEPLSGGNKINSFKIDENHFKKIEKNFIDKMKEHTFKPFWNPHTEDVISKNIRKINKTRKIRN